jgi:pilus assembly protein CpaE
MNSLFKVCVLYGSGTPDTALRQVLSGMDNVKLLRESQDLETFLAQYQETPPDLVLVDLEEKTQIRDWLEPLLARLPHSQVVVCSKSRDPDFLIPLMSLRPGGFLPLPLNPDEFLRHLERLAAEREKPSHPGGGRTLAVTSTKGGGGVTSVATNLAIALASILPGEVILMDLARPFPHVGQFLDLKSQHNIKDLADSTGSLDPLFMQKVIQKHKSGLDILLGYPNYYLESRAFPELPSLDKIFQTLRASYQWIIVDLGGWLDPLYFRVLQKSDEILLLVQLSVPDLQNLKIFESLFRDLDIEEGKVKVVVNHYTKDYRLLGLKDVENICRKPVYFTLPHDYISLMESINQGIPLGEAAPRSKLWRQLLELAKDLVERAPKAAKTGTANNGAQRKGIFQRFFPTSGD